MTFRATGGAALASGIALWAAGPAVGAGLLAWLALVPAAAVSLAAPRARAGRLAVPLAYALYLELLLVPALPFGLARNQWGDPALPIVVGDSPVLAVALVGVPLAGLALYAVRFPLLGVEPRGLGGAVVVPAVAWTGLDVVRVKLDPSGSWGPLFLSQHDTAAAPLAALAGPWALTFAVVAVNYLLALALVRRELLRPAAGLAAIALALGVAALLHPTAATGTATVAVLQPGYDTSEFDRPLLRPFRPENRDYEPGTLGLLRDFDPLARRAAAAGADLVVWPEATAWVDPRATPSVRAALGRLARDLEAGLVVPYFLRSRAESAVLGVRAAGDLTSSQPKQRPMWFLGERSAERPASPVTVGGVATGFLLGVDNQDPGAARTLVARGAALLAASTHDWPELAVQQRAASRLHAVGLGVPVARADWRYGSAVFDSDGRVAADLGASLGRDVATAAVTLRRPTPYARVGDLLAWVALALAGAVGAATLLRGRASAG